VPKHGDYGEKHGVDGKYVEMSSFMGELHPRIVGILNRTATEVAKTVDGAPKRFNDIPYAFKQCAALAYVAACMLDASIGGGCGIMREGLEKKGMDEEEIAKRIMLGSEATLELFGFYASDRMATNKAVPFGTKISIRISEEK